MKWTFYIRDLKHWWRIGRRQPNASGRGDLNVIAHARLVAHMQSRKWKPAAWHPAVNMSKFTCIITSHIHFPERNFISIAYLTFDIFVPCIFVLKTPEIQNWDRSSWTSTRELHWNFLVCVLQLFAKQKGLQVKEVLNHKLFCPFFIFKHCRDLSPSNCWLYFSLYACKGDGVVRQTWFGAMPRSDSYGTLPTSILVQGKGRCMERDSCKPEEIIKKEKLADKKSSKEKKKEKEEKQLHRNTCKALQNTSFTFPLFTWETHHPQQACASLSSFPTVNDILDPVLSQHSSLWSICCQCIRSLLWQWSCPNFQGNSLYKSQDT